jgi:alcohol dehydrogenase (cytochrome c)
MDAQGQEGRGQPSCRVVYIYWNEAVPIAAMAINYVRYMAAPAGTISTERAPGSPATTSPLPAPPPAGAADADWPSYNKTLTSNRFSPLAQINRNNVGSLKILCTYDTGQYTGFTSGLIEVNGALIGTTEYDIFSIDPANCHQNWRTHESYEPATPQGVNRGAAYLDGRLFRGTQDGRVLAYDFKTGKRLWATAIADPAKGETVPAAPIAWNGLVFAGNAGGDIKGVKGRMYALDAKTGKIVWEFYLVPKGRRTMARGPQGASPLDWRPGKTRPAHRSPAARPGHPTPSIRTHGAALCAGRQPGARFRHRAARRGEPVFRVGRRAGRQDRRLQDAFQDRAARLA